MFEDESDQGAGFACGRDGNGLQAHRGRAGPLASRQCPTPGALVRAGVTFNKGKLLERPTNITPPEPADTSAATAESEVA
jgi:hypothetical protein